MTIGGICYVTRDVPAMASFYAAVPGVPSEGDDRHAGIGIGGLHITFRHPSIMEEMAPGSAAGAGPGAFTPDVQVADVDAEHGRIVVLGAVIIKPPVSYPWGSRSMWFRNPEGNIVNFFQRI